MEYIIYTIVAAAAFWFGWHVRGIVITINIAQNPDKAIKMLEQIKKINAAETVEELNSLAKVESNKVESNEVKLNIERVGDQLFAYDSDTGHFIAQGPDLTAVLESAHKRFPSQFFFGTIDNDSPAKELA